MKYSISALVLGLFAVLSVAAPAATPDDDVDPNKVYIEGITYAGSGCKAGSVAISKSSDYKTVTLAFDSYVASIGPGVPFVEKRKNCNINVKLHYPGGYQYTLYQTDYTGYADLEKGVTAKQQSQYWFAGFADQKAILQSTWKGQYKNSFTFRDTLAHEAVVWSPCGASTTLNIDTQMTLDNSEEKKASGLITTDVIDHKVKTIYGVRWRKC
ncbi:hypothetical protein HOY80DRAFT_177426 [Tuber brumale]|nr:hypothetical protein HOY80DRAFT_177426 [Tuber brumale]